MTGKGHEVLIISRDKEVTFELLDNLGFHYVSRGRGGKGLIGKLIYMIRASVLIYRRSIRFRPDIFLSFGSIYAAIAAKIYGKPHIAFDDTEHAKLDLMLYPPLTKCILTPESFRKNLGGRHIRFKGFMELCYLHAVHFKPDIEVLKLLGVQKDEQYALVRFVSWNASHDQGQAGFDNDGKLELIGFLLKRMKVFISSENDLPAEIKKCRLDIPPHMLHHALAFSSVYIGEGATTASEAVMLGIPSFYINSLTAGTLEDQENSGLLHSFRNSDGLQMSLEELLGNNNEMTRYKAKASEMIDDMIDVTSFMVWFIESFPDSMDIMKNNPSYQQNFKTG